jgi:hypothetical protein
MDSKDTIEHEEQLRNKIKNDYYNPSPRIALAELLRLSGREVEAARVEKVPIKAKRPFPLIVTHASETQFLHEFSPFSPTSEKTALKMKVIDSFYFTRKRPLNFDSLPETVQNNIKIGPAGEKVFVAESYISAYRNTFLSANGGFVAHSNRYLADNRMGHGSFLANILFDPLNGWHLDLGSTPETLDEPIFVFQRHPMLNYYHLVAEQLPCLLIYKIFMEGYEAKCLTFRNGLNNIINEFSTIIGLKMDNFRYAQNSFVFGPLAYRVDPADTHAQNGSFITPQLQYMLQWLDKNHNSKIYEASNNKRIFISRGDTSKRSIINENELYSALGRLGFEKVILSGMSLCEQIALFRSSRIIVGGHGAGLVNTAFCVPNSTVIELSNYHTTSRASIFFDIAAIRDLRYYLCVSESDSNDFSAPFKVDIDSIIALVNQIISNSK